MEVPMDNKQKQLYELTFIILCLRLFERYRHPAAVFSFLKSCCTMYQLDLGIVQQAIMKVMRQQYNLKYIVAEVCYLYHRAGADTSEIIKFAKRPRSTVYKILKTQPTKKSTCLIMTEKELEVIALFLYNYKDMGGMIT